MVEYSSKQIEEIAMMILMFGRYRGHKIAPYGFPRETREEYIKVTPEMVRKKVEELNRNPDKMNKVLGDPIIVEGKSLKRNSPLMDYEFLPTKGEGK